MSDLLDEAHEFLLCMDKMEYADALFALRAELTEARRQLAAQPAVPEAVAKDAAKPCRHSNSTFVRETADCEAERWVCHDCGMMFTREVPQ